MSNFITVIVLHYLHYTKFITVLSTYDPIFDRIWGGASKLVALFIDLLRSLYMSPSGF